MWISGYAAYLQRRMAVFANSQIPAKERQESAKEVGLWPTRLEREPKGPLFRKAQASCLWKDANFRNGTTVGAQSNRDCVFSALEDQLPPLYG
jgi:hypothetical protein